MGFRLTIMILCFLFYVKQVAMFNWACVGWRESSCTYARVERCWPSLGEESLMWP